MTEKNQAEQIMLKNVRLSFPSLYKKAEKYDNTTGKTIPWSEMTEEEKGKAKYVTTLLIPKDNKELIKKITDVSTPVIKSVDGKITEQYNCIKDGDTLGKAGEGYDYTKGAISIKAGTKFRFPIVDKKRKPVYEEDGLFYSGCYVNALISFFPYKTGIGANLLAIQFHKDGESLETQSSVEVNSVFDIEEDDDSDF